MQTQFTCRRGHRWQVDLNEPGTALHGPATAASQAVVCPQCGGIGQTAPVEDPDATCAYQQPPCEPRGGAQRRQIARFEILSVLGEGAFGTVYRARDPQLQREVAIKVPRPGVINTPNARERFLRESRAAATLNHAHICPVYEAGEHEGQLYLVMAFVPGKTLAAVMAKGKPVTAGQAAWLARKVAQALEEAHGHGIVHRDLKPANIMINPRGEPVIMDFGLAQRRQAGDPRLTLDGVAMGTPAYMPPEQARGDTQTIGPASDIYSLGVILYELLCGRRPFEGSFVEVMNQVLSTTPAPPSHYKPDVDPQLEAICLEAMAKEPAQRYGSMGELAAALSEYLRRQNIPQPPPLVPPVQVDVETMAAPAQTATVGAMREGISINLLPKVRRTKPRRPFPVGIALGAGLAGVVMMLGLAYHWRSSATARPAENALEEELPPATAAPASANRGPPALLSAPFTAAQASQAQQAWAAYLGQPQQVVDGAGISLLLIPPGEFDMGSPPGPRQDAASTEANLSDEALHRVRITRPFYLAAHEVTVGQFLRFWQESGFRTEAERIGQGGTGWNESSSKAEGPDSKYNWSNPGFSQTDDHPVVNVSWNDAQEFCAWLSRKEGKSYRLPTEAEWEYACRAGTTTTWSYGDDPEMHVLFGNCADAAAKARLSTDGHNRAYLAASDGYAFTAPVGKFRANAFGLFDMHGNVGEWCHDRYGAKYYNLFTKTVSDPRGEDSGWGRVVRGGCFDQPPWSPAWRQDTASANRHAHPPYLKGCEYGFRVARDVPPQPTATGAMNPADATTFGGHAYKFFAEQTSWKVAAVKCALLGGHLVTIDSAEENQFVAKLVAGAGRVDAWIGITDEGQEGVWRTVDGRPLTYTNWFANQPNNKANEEHYGLLSNRTFSNPRPMGWTWCDQPNESKQHQPGYVCEWDHAP